MDEGLWCDHFGETLAVFQEADDEGVGWVSRHCSSEIYESGGNFTDGREHTIFNRPG